MDYCICKSKLEPIAQFEDYVNLLVDYDKQVCNNCEAYKNDKNENEKKNIELGT